MSEPIKDQVYKQFLQEKSIVLSGEIDNDSFERVAMQIIKYNMEDDALEKDGMCENCGKLGYDRTEEPIKIFISSPGGLVDACLAIAGAIESSKTPVHGIVLGEAASAAFVILVACSKRSSYKHARLMYHELSTGMRGSLVSIKDKVDECEILQKNLNDIVISNTKITKEILEEKINRRDWNMSVTEALSYGVIDEVI